MHPSGLANAVEAQKYLETGHEKFSGFCRIKPFGASNWIWLYGTARPFNKNDSGKVKDMICVFQDLSARNTPFQFELAIKSLLLDQLDMYLSNLTKRECDVFYQILSNHSNEFIANNLFISTATVKTHKRNIHKKLGMHTVRPLFSLLSDQ